MALSCTTEKNVKDFSFFKFVKFWEKKHNIVAKKGVHFFGHMIVLGLDTLQRVHILDVKKEVEKDES